MGSARMWSADELYERGVIDVLAEKGKGEDVVRKIISDPNRSNCDTQRVRFERINREKLFEAVTIWVERAMDLPAKQIKAMKFILKAQRVARERRETGVANRHAVRTQS